MVSELIALLNGRTMGSVQRDRQGRLSFRYDDNWRISTDAIPISISMPLTALEHGNKPISSFLWGLLPDNEAVLDRWARNFQVSARNPFSLISYVGEDCAGAVQFVCPERVEACASGEPESVVWLDEFGVAERLRMLREDHSAWRAPMDTGQFSLAGAQPKTALLFDEGKWGVPSGRMPTTHILKPPTGEFDGHSENEHFCLVLARRLGLPTASTSIMKFGEETAIVIERYDRIRSSEGLLRVHQEDICQAKAVLPMRKYESEGGLGAKEIIELLRIHSSSQKEDIETFLDALAFNWLIAGTDAHAKNYSLLLGSRGQVRLAPLYDIASALPYDDMYFPKLKLAMRIGRKYRLREISGVDWQRLAKSTGQDTEEILTRIANLARQIPDEAAQVRNEMRQQGIKHKIVDRLSDKVSSHAEDCVRLLGVK